MSLKERNKYIKKNTLAYKELTGIDVPKGVEVHHIDRNTHNNTLENLVLLHPEEHWFAHFEMFLKAKLEGNTNEERANAMACNAIKNKYKFDEPLITGWSHKTSSRKKMSESSMNNQAFLGKTHSEETKRKISDAQKGKTISESTKKKLSEAYSGDGNPFHGKTHSLETKAKVAKANAQRPFVKKNMKFLGIDDYQTAKKLLGL